MLVNAKTLTLCMYKNENNMPLFESSSALTSAYKTLAL